MFNEHLACGLYEQKFAYAAIPNEIGELKEQKKNPENKSQNNIKTMNKRKTLQ